MINGPNLFDQSVKNNLITYDKIQKISTGELDDYTTDSLLDYNYLNNYNKMIVIDLTKKQTLDADPKAIQQMNFTANQDQEGQGQGTSKIVFKSFILF